MKTFHGLQVSGLGSEIWKGCRWVELLVVAKRLRGQYFLKASNGYGGKLEWRGWSGQERLKSKQLEGREEKSEIDYHCAKGLLPHKDEGIKAVKWKAVKWKVVKWKVVVPLLVSSRIPVIHILASSGVWATKSMESKLEPITIEKQQSSRKSQPYSLKIALLLPARTS